MIDWQRSVYDDAWDMIESGLVSAARIIHDRTELRQIAEGALDVFEFRRQFSAVPPIRAQAGSMNARDDADRWSGPDARGPGPGPLLLSRGSHAAAHERSNEAVLTCLGHEFRTPLNGILGSLEGLKEEIQGDEHRALVEAALSSAKRLSQTLLCILRLAEIESARLHPGIRPCNVTAVLAKVMEEYARRALLKGIAIRADRSNAPCIVPVDPEILTEALGHLMDNAVKFSSRGCIRTEIRRTAYGQEKERRVEIVIADEGIGIPASRIGVVQDSFRQASEGYTRLYEGIGLGLTIATRLVELMRGSLRMESTEGRGTTVLVSLPAE